MLHVLVQALAIANFGYAIYWDLYILQLPTQRSFGGQWKYLTFWNMWIQLAYFTISFLNNIFGSHETNKKSSSSLQRFRDLFFSSLAFPIGQFVGIVFWGLFHYNRELVFPAAFDKFFPNYINHMMHTTVLVVQLLELVLLYHPYPQRKYGMSITMFFCILYLSWTLVVAFYGGIWVYPIFEVLQPLQRVGFMAVCALFGGFLYFLGEHLNHAVWAGRLKTSVQRTQSKPKIRRAKAE